MYAQVSDARLAILTWRPCNFRVSGLLESNVPFNKIISVFCIERVKVSPFHTIPQLFQWRSVRSFDLDATISGNYYQEVVCVCDRMHAPPSESVKQMVEN